MLAGRSGCEHKHGKYKKCLTMMMLTYIKKQATFEVQFMKKLSNTGAELKRSIAYKKAFIWLSPEYDSVSIEK